MKFPVGFANDCFGSYSATVMVPSGTYDRYKSCQGWKNFLTIKEMDPTEDMFFQLSIQQGTGGSVSVPVEQGKTFKVRFTPDSGWRIHSVTFNDINVTGLLDWYYTYTTPAIQGNSSLIVVYERNGSQTTAIRPQDESLVKIEGLSFGVRITGTEHNDLISIFTTDGMLVKTVRADGPQVDIPLDRNHVYIIKVGAKELKVRI